MGTKPQEENANKTLQVYDCGIPMTQTEGAVAVSKITLEMVEQNLSRASWEDLVHISGKCPRQDGAFVGHGTCLVKKYLKHSYMGNLIDDSCASCKANKIMQELNHIFRCEFDGRYQVEWKLKRGHLMDDVKPKQKRGRPQMEPKAENILAEPKRKPGRPKKVKEEPVAEPTAEPIASVPKRKPGRPRKIVEPLPEGTELRPKRKPGRPKKSTT
jgi:hypothetical protein